MLSSFPGKVSEEGLNGSNAGDKDGKCTGYMF